MTQDVKISIGATLVVGLIGLWAAMKKGGSSSVINNEGAVTIGGSGTQPAYLNYNIPPSARNGGSLPTVRSNATGAAGGCSGCSGCGSSDPCKNPTLGLNGSNWGSGFDPSAFADNLNSAFV